MTNRERVRHLMTINCCHAGEIHPDDVKALEDAITKALDEAEQRGYDERGHEMAEAEEFTLK